MCTTQPKCRLANRDDKVDPSCDNAGCELYPNDNAKVGRSSRCACSWCACVGTCGRRTQACVSAKANGSLAAPHAQPLPACF